VRSEEVRFVWVFVFFDLPVGTKTDRRNATRFRKFLKDDGFLMLQLSVYARVCRAEEAAEKHVQRVMKRLPPKGSVRTLQVTDKQYARMKLLLGEANLSEKKAAEQLGKPRRLEPAPGFELQPTTGKSVGKPRRFDRGRPAKGSTSVERNARTPEDRARG
jgi:CRISPR-associated protein Cas2